MSPKALDSCGTCRFWIALPEQSQVRGFVVGACRRRSPTRNWDFAVSPPHSTRDGKRWTGRWPLTAEDDWCGEHSNEETTRYVAIVEPVEVNLAEPATSATKAHDLLTGVTALGKTEAEFEEDQRG